MNKIAKQILVIGHADADGHLIVEQVRRNLSLISSFNVTAIVDPSRTKDHKAWLSLELFPEIDKADVIFFVDLMFGPSSFVSEAAALVMFVQSRSDKRFFLIDHHPLPLRRLAMAPNLRSLYRPDVIDVAVGPRSGMMVVAAICEKQGALIENIKSPSHEVFALAMRRAAALGGPLPGQKLLKLLEHGRWDLLFQLGKDDAKLHRLPRGRRPAADKLSNILKELDTAAIELLALGTQKAYNAPQVAQGRITMPYDLDIDNERYSLDHETGRHLKNSIPQVSSDLEAIVTLLEVAAISLTPEPGITFTLPVLIQEARSLGGDDLDLNERDIKIVLEKASFLEKSGSQLRLR